MDHVDQPYPATTSDDGVCISVREAVSARHDRQPLPDGTVWGSVVAHLDVCAPCTEFTDRLPSVAALSARAAAAVTPDLTGSVLAAVTEQERAEVASKDRQLRWLVGFAGAVQLVLALPVLVGAVGPDVHAGRDLGALQLAIGVGLVLAALQPRRAVGVLPVAAVVAAVTVIVAVIDVAAGQATVAAELTHLSEVVGVVALWVLVRRTPHDATVLRPVEAW